ncbi:MAG: ABC transporter substrate-binding protein, partial [Victivallaceae bacterium]
MKLYRFKLNISRLLLAVAALLAVATTLSCRDDEPVDDNLRVIRLNSSDRIKSLDPALGSDSASMKMIAVLYDTLLQYDYMARPYKLIPSMLSEMPSLSADQLRYHFTLRDDLIFPHNRRPISSRDVAFSILRIADGRMHSPLYWMYRGKIVGIDEFHQRTGKLAAGDFSAYEAGIAGIKIINPREFEITLTRPDPRFLYMLALPFSGVVCRESAEK